MEPLDFRRTLAATGAFGATMAVKPGNEAIEAVKKVAPKGADVVLEMVGHNQDGPVWWKMSRVDLGTRWFFRKNGVFRRG